MEGNIDNKTSERIRLRLLAEFDDVEIPCLATATSHLQVRLR